ncbi:MAG TPA: HNH endonuclease signature motif containing protein [Thermoanaerobaculaceae bacterium]|nr:HNH endonuclease signature motif containing protein [Thermoanaerobaculaceae bacterium]
METRKTRPGRLKQPVDYENGPNPGGLCMCGCGEATPIARVTTSQTGTVAGKPQRYVRGHQNRSAPFDYVEDADGCWIYQQHIGAWGYGIKRCPRRKRQTGAHVVFYERAHGPVPEGYVVDHMCHNADTDCPGGTCKHRRCVNPDHLRAITGGENVKASGRGPIAANAVKTHCDHGHEFTPANTYWRPDRTGRQCRPCKRERDRQYAATHPRPPKPRQATE